MRKFSKFLSKGISLFGFLCLGIVIIFQLWFESSGREIFFSEQVVKLKNSMGRNQIVTNDSWYYDKIPKSTLIEGVITNPDEIVGKSVTEYIPYNAQLSPTYFELPELITDKNHLTMKIPNDWIYSIPNTLRSRDKIVLKEVTSDVLEVEKTKELNNDPSLLAAKEQEKQNQEKSANTTQNAEDAAEDVVPTYTTGEQAAVAVKAGEIVLETTVAYVKDSSNREVVSISTKDRNDGTSVIRDVEIVATLKDVQKLESFVKKGSKFIIMYREG